MFGAKVIALGLNPEGYDRKKIPEIARELEQRYGIPCCDPLTQGAGKLVDAVMSL